MRSYSILIGLGVALSLSALYLSGLQFLDVVDFKILDAHFRLRGAYDPGMRYLSWP